jgi:hypothetical protein
MVRSLTTSKMSEADLNSGGVTNAPDLAEIQLPSDNSDLEDNEALFIFDEAIDTIGTSPTAFAAYDLLYAQCSVGSTTSVSALITAADAGDGDATYEIPDGEGYDDDVDFSNACMESPTRVALGSLDDDEFNNRSVLVTFSSDVIDNEFFLGGQVQDEASVSEAGDDNLSNDDDVLYMTPDDAIFEDGDVAGPQLISADVETESTFSGDFRDFLITLTFDKALNEDAALAGEITYWYEDGDNVEQEDIALGDCEIDDDTNIVCTIDDEDSTLVDATVISVSDGVVSSDATYTVDDTDEDITFSNPEASVSVAVDEPTA